jgi:hypothetical protein
MNIRPSFFCLTAALLLSLPAQAEVLEDFSSYKPGDNFTTGQTLGTATNGWTGGWRTNSSYTDNTGRVDADKPLDAGQYLDVTLFAAAGQPQKPSGAIARPYKSPDKPFTLIFRFRPAASDEDLRYFIFDNDTRSAGPAGTASWQIESHDGFWRLIDGEGNGNPATPVDTDLPVIAGAAYTFTLTIDPVQKIWSASISDGTRTVVHRDLHFRTATLTPERWLHFGANELSAPALGVTIRYAVDSVSIQP